MGTYTIRAEKTGYATAIETVTIYEGKSASVVIKMAESDANNNLPVAPFGPVPANASTGLGIEHTLEWHSIDDDDDPLTYDVYLFNSDQNPNSVIAEDISDSTLLISDLKYGTTYFWQVAVDDGVSGPVFSEVWSFAASALSRTPLCLCQS